MIDIPRGPSHSPHADRHPDMQRDFEQMQINPSSPFGHNNNNGLHNPQNLPFHGRPGSHGHSSNSELFDDLESSSPRYEGYIFTRAEIPDQEKRWGRVQRKELQLTQDQFLSEIQRERKKGVIANDVYQHEDMNGKKREHVDKLIKDKTLNNPRFEYKLASLKLERAYVRGARITKSMRVILKRKPSPGDAFARMQALNSEIVDLTGNDIHNNFGGSPFGSPRGSHGSFMHQMDPMYPEPRMSDAPRTEPWVHVNGPNMQGPPPHPSPRVEQMPPSFGRPQEQFGHPQEQFGHPQEQFGHPQEQFGHPQDNFNVPPPPFQPPHHDDRFQPEPFSEDQHHSGPPMAKNKPKNDKDDFKQSKRDDRGDNKQSKQDDRGNTKDSRKGDKGNTRSSKKDDKKYRDSPSRSDSESYSDHSDFSKTKTNRTENTDFSGEEHYYKDKKSSRKYKDNQRDSYSSRDQNHEFYDRDDHRRSSPLGRKDSRRHSRSSHEFDRDSYGALREHRRKSPYHSATSSQSSGSRYYVDEFEFIPSRNSRHERPYPFHRNSSFSQDHRPTLHQRTPSYEDEGRAARRTSGFKGNRTSSFSNPVDGYDERLVQQIAKDVEHKIRTEGLEKENEKLRRRQAMMENTPPIGLRKPSSYAEPQYMDQDLPYSEPRYKRRVSSNLQRGGMYSGMI